MVGFGQFKDLVYNHTVAMPKLGIAEGNTPGERLHMGNYDPLRIPESQLKLIYDWAKNDLGFRPYLEARLTQGTGEGATYVLKIENGGLKQKGPAAQDLTINMVLPAGVTVIRATGEGYKGVHADPVAKADVAEWRVAKIAADDERSFTVTLSSAVGQGRAERHRGLGQARAQKRCEARHDEFRAALTRLGAPARQL